MELSSRNIGYMLVITTILFALLVTSFTLDTIATNDELCGCSAGEEAFCPHSEGLPLQSVFGIILVGVMGFLSYITLTNSKQVQEVNKELSNKVKNLPTEEKTIYDNIVSADGAMLQGELVEKTQLSKVKISRLLDKLEGKGLVERRRSGMANLVILKR